MKEQLSVLLQKIIYKIKWLYSNDIHYINGADTLPPPLPLEEEQRLLKTYDGTQLDVRQILIEHNLRLVVYIAKKFDNTGILLINRVVGCIVVIFSIIMLLGTVFNLYKLPY